MSLSAAAVYLRREVQRGTTDAYCVQMAALCVFSVFAAEEGNPAYFASCLCGRDLRLMAAVACDTIHFCWCFGGYWGSGAVARVCVMQMRLVGSRVERSYFDDFSRAGSCELYRTQGSAIAKLGYGHFIYSASAVLVYLPVRCRYVNS